MMCSTSFSDRNSRSRFPDTTVSPTRSWSSMRCNSGRSQRPPEAASSNRPRQPALLSALACRALFCSSPLGDARIAEQQARRGRLAGFCEWIWRAPRFLAILVSISCCRIALKSKPFMNGTQPPTGSRHARSHPTASEQRTRAIRHSAEAGGGRCRQCPITGIACARADRTDPVHPAMVVRSGAASAEPRWAEQGRGKQRPAARGVLPSPGEIKDRTFENQSFRASGLSLITPAIVHWNTVYLNRAVRQLRARGAAISDDLLAHVAPLGWEHIDLTGDYVWTASGPDAPFRPIRDVRATFSPLAA
jgi:hypothetical protein